MMTNLITGWAQVDLSHQIVCDCLSNYHNMSEGLAVRYVIGMLF